MLHRQLNIAGEYQLINVNPGLESPTLLREGFRNIVICNANDKTVPTMTIIWDKKFAANSGPLLVLGLS